MTNKTPTEFTKEEISKRALELRDDPILLFVLSEIERQYMDKWRLAAPHDTATRESCWLGVKSVEAITSQLDSLASAPKVEAFNKNLRAKHK